MKKIAICGDSFCAPSTKPEFKGTSWGELLAKKLDWELLHYARQGCSNGGIRIQIDEAIKRKVDFVIIGATSHDRIEIPSTAAPYNQLTTEKKVWGNDLQTHLLNTEIMNGYDPSAGIDNINYGNNNYRMICETIFSLAENLPHPYRSSKIDKETQTAVKYYLNNMYDSNWKKQMDEWILVQGFYELIQNHIPFFVDPNILWNTGNIRERVSMGIPDKHLRMNKSETISGGIDLFPLKNYNDDPGYHGELESQEYISNVFFNIIKNEWGVI